MIYKIFYVFFSLVLIRGGGDLETTSVTIAPESTLVINGNSNINSFSCSYKMKNIKNPIEVDYYAEPNTMKFRQAALKLDIDCFDCGGKAINSDFQEVLRSKEQPQLLLYLKEISPISTNKSHVNAHIEVSIAGVTNSYEIPIIKSGDNGLCINGGLTLCLSDFNLEAPNKLFGLISIHDQVDINFELAIHEN